MANFPSLQVFYDLFRYKDGGYVPDPDAVVRGTSNQVPPLVGTYKSADGTQWPCVYAPDPFLQPKGDTAGKTSTMDIPTLNEQAPKPFNPYTGKPRDPRDVETDPLGLLIEAPETSGGMSKVAASMCDVRYQSAKPFNGEHETAPANDTATGILAKARQHMLDRAATYDKPEGERSMLQTVKVFNAYTGRDLSESEGWLLMDVLKTVRDLTGEKPHRDSLEDKVAYGSLYAESRLRENKA